MLNKCYLGSSLHDSWSNTELLQLINSESMLLLVTEKENNTQIFKGLMEYPDMGFLTGLGLGKVLVSYVTLSPLLF